MSRQRWLQAVTVVGVLASLLYFSWWFQDGRLGDPWLALGFVLAGFYVFAQIYCAWFVYLHVHVPETRAAPPGLTVDVLVPVYDEPYELVRESLAAAVAIAYPHRTHLLDDSGDPRFAALAEELGAGYLRRDDHRDAKAGNVNAALDRTDGALVVVFDVDHVARPDFLDAVLGHFDDPRMGFVQSGVVFRNREESDVARATAGQAHDIYGPTSMGMSGCGAASVWGSHTTFRRAALASIGGYQPGLAEDLHTSLSLHAAGWRSLYVPTAHADGLVPSDVVAFTKQQLKWARGVFEMLVWAWPRFVRSGLTVSQSLAYLVRLTYYLIGPLFLVHAFAAIVVLIRNGAAAAGFVSYLWHAIPLGIVVILMRRLVNEAWNPHEAPAGNAFNWRGYAQAGALWPIYSVALACAILRIPIPHIATPKERVQHAHPALVAPQIGMVAVLLAAMTWRVASGFGAADAVVVLFAGAVAAIQLPTILSALKP